MLTCQDSVKIVSVSNWQLWKIKILLSFLLLLWTCHTTPFQCWIYSFVNPQDVHLLWKVFISFNAIGLFLLSRGRICIWHPTVCLFIQSQGRRKLYFLYQDKVGLVSVFTSCFLSLKAAKVTLRWPCHHCLTLFPSFHKSLNKTFFQSYHN